jgi:hypothetical protein
VGVFALRDFEPGECIDIQRVIVVPSAQLDDLEKTVLGAYYYAWNAGDTDGAVVMGTFSFVNHAYQPNARDEPTPDGASMALIALCFIPRGAEIFICYSGASDDRTPLWFDVV